MPKLKPIIARTPEELARALGLSAVAAKEWQVQHVMLRRLKEIAQHGKLTHAHRKTGGHLTHQSDCNPER